MANVDENRTRTVEELVNENMGLIGFYMGRYPEVKGYTYDEYHSELLIALWKAATTYDPSGCRFSTYAVRGFHFCRMTLRRAVIRSSKVRPCYNDDPSSVIAQASCTDRTDLEDSEVLQYNKEFLYKLINMIDGKRREIILRHLDGLSHGEIAKERGIHYHNVTELKRLAIQNIREAIQESGIEWEYLYD